MNNNVDKIIREIDKWYLSGERFLNIQSLPYTLLDMFIKLFKKEDVKILYITNESEKISIIEKLESIGFEDYIYYIKGSELKKVNIVNFEIASALNSDMDFNVVIYDDLHCYPTYEYEDISNLILMLVKNSKRAICLSIECIFNGVTKIIYPLGRYPYAFVEPLFIQTRVNLREDMCTFAYDFINWSITEQKKVIIYTPGYNRMYDVLGYLRDYYKNSDLPILENHVNRRGINDIIAFNFYKVAIIVTNNFDDRMFNYENKNIIVLFADSKLLNYRQIIDMCGRVYVKDEFSRSEIVLIGATQSTEVEKSLKITRELNRIAWESGFLSMRKMS